MLFCLVSNLVLSSTYSWVSIHSPTKSNNYLFIFWNNEVFRKVYLLEGLLIQDVDRALLINEHLAYSVSRYLHFDHHRVILIRIMDFEVLVCEGDERHRFMLLLCQIVHFEGPYVVFSSQRKRTYRLRVLSIRC